MEEGGATRLMRIQLDLYSGRDDHLLQLFKNVKPRHRAEHLRMLLTRLSASSGVVQSGQLAVMEGKLPTGEREAAAKMHVPQQTNGKGTGGGIDLSGLDDVSMDMDFSTLGR